MRAAEMGQASALDFVDGVAVRGQQMRATREQPPARTHRDARRNRQSTITQDRSPTGRSSRGPLEVALSWTDLWLYRPTVEI